MAKSLHDVLRAGTCSGCGACVLAGQATTMAIDGRGDLRPVPAGHSRAAVPLAEYCPALVVRRPARLVDQHVDRDFGPWLRVWVAHATDLELRHRGSSGGALSALAAYLLDHGSPGAVVMRSGPGTRTTGLVVRSAADVPETAASRYAPASALATLAEADDPNLAVVCRPCEASALRSLRPDEERRPPVLSFFCAGVPSQWATDELVRALGADVDDVTDVRYRGNGWPGRFTVTDRAGRMWTTTYDDSWGHHLGRRLQDRCKICPDGVGESADVSAADLWEADERGYPVFADAPGRSLVIARTPRGVALVAGAVAAGYLDARTTDLTLARTVQALHVQRRRLLLGRLAGRRAAGAATPRYRGFGLWQSALRHPLASLRQARGSFVRTRAARGEPASTLEP